jgi:hypothetical protein
MRGRGLVGQTVDLGSDTVAPGVCVMKHEDEQPCLVQPTQYFVSLLACVCVCVCAREREREKERVCVSHMVLTR